MEFLATLAGLQPPTLHFSLHNPPDSTRVLYAPRTLAPLGLFVTVEVRDRRGRVVYESPTVRGTPKLDPASPESYQEIQPGYTFGVVLALEGFAAPPGDYQLALRYTNGPFQGTPQRPVGRLKYQTTLAFTLP